MADSNDSYNAFIKDVERRTESLGVEMLEFPKRCATLDQDVVFDACRSVAAAVHKLTEIVSENHRPEWLREMEDVTEILDMLDSQLGRSAGKTLLPRLLPKAITDIVTTTPKVRCHRWHIDDAAPFIDVDRIFEKYRKESRLGELADSLVTLLEKIAQCPSLDSARLQKSLARIIAMLRSTKSGSWFSVFSTREYTRAYFTKFLLHLSKAAPGVGPVIEAAHETWKEFSVEIDRIQTRAKEEVQRLALEDVSQMPEWILRLADEGQLKIAGPADTTSEEGE